MKITPIEIRQKAFTEKMLRGYDKDEVMAFLQSLSQEWERVLEENREYRIKLEVTQREVQKLREVETSLYKTLKTAEDTSTQLIEQANRSADLQMREARTQAEALLNEARTKAEKMLQDAENQSRTKLEETLSELRKRENDLRQLEGLKENLLKEVRNIANDTLERISRVAEKGNSKVFDEKIREVRNLLEQKPADAKLTETKLPEMKVPELKPTDPELSVFAAKALGKETSFPEVGFKKEDNTTGEINEPQPEASAMPETPVSEVAVSPTTEEPPQPTAKTASSFFDTL